MKTLSSYFISFFFSVPLTAGDTSIIFSHTAYQAIFTEAKAREKMVFLYFHFNGCGACVQMEKTTFQDPEVARFFNERFINFEINTLQGEGININQIYQVKSHPTFMFLNHAGEIVHQIVGVFSPEDFIKHAETAIRGTGTVQYYRDQYRQGNRDPEFLRACTYALRDANAIPFSLIGEYLQTQNDAQLQEEHNLRYIYEFAYHQHQPHIALGSPAYQLMLEHQHLFEAYFDPEQIDTRLLFIALHAADQAISSRDDSLFQHALQILRRFPRHKRWEYKEMDGRITGMMTKTSLVETLEIAYANVKGEEERAQRLTREKAKAAWHDPDELNTMAWDRYTGKSSRSELKEALSWVKRSIRLDANYYNMDTYAALLYRTGQYKSARRIATRAIEMARQSGLSYQDTEDLLKKIVEGK